MERAALTIAAAGAGAKILGPQGKSAVVCDGAALTLQGLAVECRATESYHGAVFCGSKGRAELAGCALSSPGGHGLAVAGGLGVHGGTAEVQGGTIADCGDCGVECYDSGSKATVRTARPRTAETAR